ncbi:MAG TPA: GSU2403 family nucleotidyltransferase fold protein [Rhizomicrobium sp.]|nr:GSU2403 family nucleotidyltransferase fold protein [Rhizomicrobium sp.]
MPAPSLFMQTTYAELLDRSASAAFNSAFTDDGSFVLKTIKGKRYWYFQKKNDDGRQQKYVGPETPELLDQIAYHRQSRDDERERRALVSTLVRSFGLPRPIKEIGDTVAALAMAGIFRLRGVLVGTVAYQTYSPMLGMRLPKTILQTGDVDIAQFQNISIAVDEKIPPVLDLLKKVDKSFRPVPHIHEKNVTSYAASSGLRVDFLTPNTGKDTDVPRPLRAFRTDAEPLRFLDFLIYDPEPAVLLHGAGIYVLVPSPQRYAVHKLIVSRRRQQGAAKQDKDLQQSAALLNALNEKRPYEVKAAWQEAYGRGPIWQKLLCEGLSYIPQSTRDSFLMTTGQLRHIIPGLDLKFFEPRPHYDLERDIVAFVGESGNGVVQCAISREALDDNFGASTGISNEQRLDKFRKNRSSIEAVTREKYLNWPIEEPARILIRTMEVPKLLSEIANKADS